MRSYAWRAPLAFRGYCSGLHAAMAKPEEQDYDDAKAALRRARGKGTAVVEVELGVQECAWLEAAPSGSGGAVIVFVAIFACCLNGFFVLHVLHTCIHAYMHTYIHTTYLHT